MANSRAKGKLVLLDSHKATGAEASYLLTKALKETEYSEIMIIIKGASTAAFDLLLKINAYAGTTQHTTTEQVTTVPAYTVTREMSLAFFRIADSVIIGGTESFQSKIILKLNPLGAGYILLSFESYRNTDGAKQSGFGWSSGITGDISSIELKTSTSTWITGTTIDTYGLRK